MEKERFRLTQYHIDLLSRANIDFQWDCYEGAAGIDQKRPYGNKDVYGDIFEIVDPRNYLEYEQIRREHDIDLEAFLKLTKDKTKWTFKDLKSIHTEIAKALEIVLQTKSFEPGEYEREFLENWKKA